MAATLVFISQKYFRNFLLGFSSIAFNVGFTSLVISYATTSRG